MNNPASKDWLEILTGEMLLLSLLGRIIYKYPEAEERIWLQSLIDEDVFLESPFASNKDETNNGLKLLQNWGKGGIDDEAFENIRADYTRLFIGTGKVLAPPWESVHFDDDRLIFQERTLKVRTWYQRFGLEVEKKYEEPDDHIGLELLFLSHLATLGIQALEKDDQTRFDELLDAQRDFFKKHPGTWAPTWCGLVDRNAQTDFYKGLAHLTHGALSALSEVLDVKLAKDIAE